MFTTSLLRIATSVKFANIKSLSTTKIYLDNHKCKLLVVGGGTGGIAVAANLTSKLDKNSIIILEPNEKHYYQPMFTMIGGGMKKLSESVKPMHSVIPNGTKWIKDEAQEFQPNSNKVITKSGDTIEYEFLLIAVGLQLNYDKIPGLTEALSVPNGNVTSIYSPLYVERHLNALKRFEKGNILFTFPASPVKCPGAPQKIFYITEHYLRKQNKRKNAQLIYNTALPVIFGVKYFADALWNVVRERNLIVNLKTTLIEVIGNDNRAIFQNTDNPEDRKTIEYSILHAVPPQSPPTVLLKNTTNLVNSSGFVDVDKNTLQHIKYSNIFAVGDCSSSPNSKTMAAAAAQAGIICKNLLQLMNGKSIVKDLHYDGYSSCPLVTGYNSCIMAEFDYNLNPLETFPFTQDRERYSMFLMKKYILPEVYWTLMLTGKWHGPEKIRKIFSIVKSKK